VTSESYEGRGLAPGLDDGVEAPQVLLGSEELVEGAVTSYESHCYGRNGSLSAVSMNFNAEH